MSIPSHLEQLRIIAERAAALCNKSRNIADQFNGARPEKPTDRIDAPSPPYLNAQFGDVISSIQRSLDELNDQLTRVQDEVLDNGIGSTMPSPSTARATRLGDNF